MPITRLSTAYTLLPPPLSALPAKYWTTISLLTHSYSVGALFQELVEAYSNSKDASNLPEPDIAFVIGFIHDMGQKLGFSKRKLESVREWVRERLQLVPSLGLNEREATSLSKYLVTNVAETVVDPTYSRVAWFILRLADRLQGTSSIGEIVSLINEFKGETGWDLKINYYHVASPHPLFRFIVSYAMHETIQSEIRAGKVGFALPISLPHGLLVLSDEPLGGIEFEWSELVYILGDTLLPEAEAEFYTKTAIPYCKEQPKRKSKNKQVKPKGVKDKNCKPLGSLRLSTYETLLLYYGPRDYADKIRETIVLPRDFADQLTNIKIKGVRYEEGEYICPYCGIRTPHGVFISEVADIVGGRSAAKEKWSRRFPPANLNRLLSKTDKFLACPLCLGEALLYSRLFANVKGERVLIANVYSAPIPVSVAYDLGKLLQALVGKYENSVISGEKPLVGLLDTGILHEVPEASTVAFDTFSTSIYGIVGLKGRKNVEITIRGIALAGLLASWGLYPLIMKPEPTQSPSSKLLTFYKGQYPLYDFSPSDKGSGHLTPYVTSLMMGVGHLYYRKFVLGETLPAVAEVLNYSHYHAPHLLQYASSHLYSHLEFLRGKLEGVSLNVQGRLA